MLAEKQKGLVTKLQEEHHKVEQLANRLRECVAVIPRFNLGPWIEEVQERYEHFRAHFTRHMALEEHDGYMAAVTEARPNLAVEVSRLKHEHDELLQIMTSIHKEVLALKPDDRLLVRDCCSRIDTFLDYVDHHEQDENLLLTFTFTHDIGTKD